MRIGIDAQIIGRRDAGYETYIENLIHALAAIDQSNQYNLYFSNRSVRRQYRGRWANWRSLRTLQKRKVMRRIWTHDDLLRFHDIDLFFEPLRLPRSCSVKTVVKIADVAFEHHHDCFEVGTTSWLEANVRRSARDADHIITVSEYSKRDIVETYGIDPQRITSIPLAASPLFRPIDDELAVSRVRNAYGLPDRYILAVGTVEPRKNLPRLIEAYSIVAQNVDQTPPLILVGKDGWLSDDSYEAVEKFGVKEKVRFTGYVPAADLPVLYSQAELFVYASFFEGFGLPPLEAMQCGTPVVTGNLTSLPEVVGDAGLQVDPYNPEAIADAIKSLLEEPEFRNELSKRGLKRAAGFSWEQTAKRTLEVFERVYDGSYTSERFGA